MNEFNWSTFGTIASSTLNQMLRSATPVALAALGGLMTEHAGIMNIGMDGMILMGAFTAAAVSTAFAGVFAASATLACALLGIFASILFGVIIGLFFALFTVKLKSDEFIIGCALNTFAMGITVYLSRSLFEDAGISNAPALSNITIPLIDRIPYLGDVISGHSLFVYLTWVFVFLMWMFVYRTPIGFWIRASGESPETLRTAGKSPERMKWIASILCGVFCGLAGAHLSLGNLNGQFGQRMVAGRGYIAFACVIFGGANPVKVFLAALMFGFFDAIGLQLQSSNLVNSDLTSAIPYVITIIMMVIVVVSGQRRRERLAKQQLKKLELK